MLLLCVPVLFIFLIILLTVNRKSEKDGGENVFKQLYIYLVLFATLMMTIGGGISLFTNAADLISPGNAYFERYEDYKANAIQEAKISKEKVDEVKIRYNYETMIEDDKRMTKQQAKNDIIKSLGFILIPFPVFLYFNRMRKQHKDTQE